MKKFFLILAVFVGVLLIAAAVFIATFDLNRYRPQILEQIQKATGKEARIGRLGLAWKGGLAARVDQVALFDAGDAEPDASLDYATVRVALKPLLRKEVQVSGVVVSGPQLTVERLADGTLSVAGIRPSAKTPASDPSSADAAQDWPPLRDIDSHTLYGIDQR